MARLALATAFLALVAALPAGAAPPNREQVRLNAADQAAARAAVLRHADLGPGGWLGGAVKPDLSSSLSCPGYRPRQSDLVLTGAARADFRNTGLQLESVAQVLKTRSMVARDWSRTVADPRALPCIRRTLGKSLPSSQQLVSLTSLAFPRLATYAAAYRGVIVVRSLGRHVSVVVDIVLLGRSRTELTLTAVAPAAARTSIAAAEVRLGRALLARVRA
jgi:hypothetical protein